MSGREIEGKEEEKQSEKGRGDWGAEKYRSDPLSGIVLALALIWAGVAWILSNADVFGPGVETWAVALAGAGVIVILGVLVRLLVPAYRRPVGGNLVLGFILLGVGLGDLLGWEIIGPLVLIAIALSIIIGVLTRKK